MRIAGRNMRRGFLAIFCALFAGLMLNGPAVADAAKDIVGTWSFIVNETTNADGTKVNTYGLHPKGIMMFDAGGNFSLFIANPERPKFASNNRLKGTPEEYQAAMHGTIAYFGKYSVDEKEKIITFQLGASTFPNWDGVTQKRPFTITGDELRYTNSGGSSGGSVLAVLKRVK